MNSRSNLLLPGLAALALLVALPAGAYWSPRKNETLGCDSTARSMLRACHFDVADNYQETQANCTNFADPDERNECLRDAISEISEEFMSCREQFDARRDACALLHEDRYDPDPLLDPANDFIDPNDIPAVYPPNPYVILTAGHTYVLRGGEEGEETVVVHVSDETREILGVQCRIVYDIVVEESEDGGDFEYEAIEVTDDWFAQTTVGDVIYCGEVARDFEDGVLRSIDGSFEAGIDYAKSGELIRMFPVAGDAHRQEFALGEAEDILQYVALATAPGADEGGDNEAFPCDPNLCLKSYEFQPKEPGPAEFKYYLPGTGFVLGVELEDDEVTGVRDELVCIGDSLDLLQDPACGIGDPDALLEELCRLSPDAFCEI